MNVEVLLFGRFRELAVRQRVVALEPGAHLVDLIERLVGEYGADFQKAISDTGQLHILINGQHHDPAANMEVDLKDEDVVAILPLAIGG